MALNDVPKCSNTNSGNGTKCAKLALPLIITVRIYMKYKRSLFPIVSFLAHPVRPEQPAGGVLQGGEHYGSQKPFPQGLQWGG